MPIKTQVATPETVYGSPSTGKSFQLVYKSEAKRAETAMSGSVDTLLLLSLGIREPPDMISGKRFFDPLPLCPHLDLIYAMKFTQPP